MNLGGRARVRRFTAAILILLLAMFTLAGCGKSEEKDQKQITVRIATDLNENDAAYRQLKRFAAKSRGGLRGQRSKLSFILRINGTATTHYWLT